MMRWMTLSCGWWLGLLTVTAGDLTLPAIISDGMVLQRSARTPVWGLAEAGAGLSVALGTQVLHAAADSEGRWLVWFDLSESGEEPLTLTAASDRGDSVVVTDILVGEVWLASGQSNMEMLLRDTIGAEAETALPANPRLRQFLVEKSANAEPVTETRGRWVAASPLTVGGFSAAGYHFAKRLQQELRVPVGLVHSSWGASALESWMSAEALDSVEFLRTARARFWQLEEQQPQRQPAQQLDDALPVTAQSPLPQKKPAYLFNGMIAPIRPYALRGVIWYQGEGNRTRAWQYREAFPLLIQDWRRQWGRGDFPFYFCQLSAFGAKDPSPGESEWAELREAQTLTLREPNTALAVTLDLGEAEDIHPRRKAEVGERLALIALARDYGRAIPHAGPRYRSMTTEGGSIRLHFDQSEGGLMARPLPDTYDVSTIKGATAPLPRHRPAGELEGFAICGADRQWVWAEARIDGDTVIVSAPGVPRPQAVRYAWSDNPTANLYNTAGQPAHPFRTDDYPLQSRNGKY